MNVNDKAKPTLRSAGYAALIEKYSLDVIPNWHRSWVVNSGVHRVNITPAGTEEIYPASYWPGELCPDHLEFALKYDGTNLAILAVLFRKIDANEFLDYLRSKPTGKYARRLWFLYEFLTGKTLPLDDVRHGSYIDLLDSDKCYTISPPRKIRRQRINDNLLGDRGFCPMVRRTSVLSDFEAADLPRKCQQTVSAYPPELVRRAVNYFYTKETKSSFEIEHIRPTSTRVGRFTSLLQIAEQEDFCTRERLIELQNRIVDERFRDTDFRSSQNYVGETVAWESERVHFVCPKPEDIAELMAGLISAHRRMEAGGVPAVIHGAAIAYGFVFMHPFEDGNGRIHRFLIHNILARDGFTPRGIMFPISASMVKKTAEYDASLEAFSRPLMPLVEYTLDDAGRMTVHSSTDVWYRYIDMTAQAEALFWFIEQTIDTELSSELSFLANYDSTKTAIQEIVDMPDRQIDLFIRFALQNNGRLSARRRSRHFESLTDEEIARMEEALQDVYDL